MTILKEEIPQIKTNTLVINKKILYAKQPVLSKYQKSYIRNVDEYSLENCIKTILEHNTDVIFERIQYNKENHTIIFYTDKVLNLNVWYDKLVTYRRKSCLHEKDIINEIKRVLNLEKSQEMDSISVALMGQVVKNIALERKNIKKIYIKRLDKILSHKFKGSIFLKDILFDYDKECLILQFNNDAYIKYSINNNILEIKDKHNIDVNNYIINDYIYNEFYVLYNLLNKKEYRDIFSKINSNNSYFEVIINNEMVNIELSFFKLFDNLNCLGKTKAINEVLFKEEEQLLNNVYVHINDCPETLKDIFYRSREDELCIKNNVLSKGCAIKGIKEPKLVRSKQKNFKKI